MKKIFATFLIVSLLVATNGVSINSLHYNDDILPIISSKISSELSEKTRDENGLIRSYIWIDSPNIELEKSDFNTNLLKIAKDVKTTSTKFEDLHNLRLCYNSKVVTKYLNNNNEFVSKYLKQCEVCYISKYSPVIVVDLTIDQIYNLSKESQVKYIDYFSDIIECESLDTTISVINTETTELYDGYGAKIGVFDAGIPSATTLSNCNVGAIHGSEYSSHADNVTNIIFQYAPSATYYFGHILVGEVYIEVIEWMIDCGVDVINMSMQIGPTIDEYSSYTRWFDHISYEHCVSFVQSAGNNMNDYNSQRGIITPGMAYNIITVGAMSYSGGIYQMEPYSSYYRYSTYASKPDISAVGNGGTSYAAPRVTGVIGQMISASPLLAFCTCAVKSLITSCVDINTTHHYFSFARSEYGTNYMQAGAGLLNASFCINAANDLQWEDSFIGANEVSKSYYINVTNSNVGKKLRISLSYDNSVIITSGDHTDESSSSSTLSNIDLYVYIPGNTSPSYISATTFNNVEIVEVPLNISGSYEVRVVQTNSNGSSTHFGLGWMFFV